MKGDMLLKAIEKVTDPWRKQRKKEEKGRPEVKARRQRVLNYAAYDRSERVTIKEVAYRCMEKAYLKASGKGKLPAHARQVMYAARPTILEEAHDTHGDPYELQDSYFTQTLLPDYIAEKGVDWDIVYDARGNLFEPHTKHKVPLGTLDVRHYHNKMDKKDDDATWSRIKKSYPTCGPDNRYGAVLFIEKEGFLPLFRAVKLAERYDLAIMSTKGQSTTAARELVEDVCGDRGIPLLVLRDFDVAGFSIAASFQKDARRYQFRRSFSVIDLGIRLADVRQWNLVSEGDGWGYDPRKKLAENGATDEEIAFLCEGGSKGNYYGNRVELNAFASDDFIRWIEGKLDEHGIKKIVPGESVLKDAYARAVKVAVVNKAIEDATEKAEEAAENLALPKELGETIQKRLSEKPELAWDTVVADEARKAYGIEIGDDEEEDDDYDDDYGDD